MYVKAVMPYNVTVTESCDLQLEGTALALESHWQAYDGMYNPSHSRKWTVSRIIPVRSKS